MSEPRPGIPVVRRTLDAMVRVWYKTPSATDYLFGPQLETMTIHLRGGGAGGQETLERALRDVLPAGAKLVRYELVA